MPKQTDEDDFHAEMHRRFAISVEQLNKLVALNAPPCILITQVLLVSERARLLDPVAWSKADTERWLARTKPSNGRCADDGCFKPLSHECQEDRLCDEHLAEAKELSKRYRESDEGLS